MQFLKIIFFEILQVKPTFRSGYYSHCLPIGKYIYSYIINISYRIYGVLISFQSTYMPLDVCTAHSHRQISYLILNNTVRSHEVVNTVAL
jgi:hypothetical protein